MEKEKILDRWTEHFNSILNQSSSIIDEPIKRLSQVEVNESLAELPNLLETQKAISRLSSGKAAGTDSIPAEIYKMGGIYVVEN